MLLLSLFVSINFVQVRRIKFHTKLMVYNLAVPVQFNNEEDSGMVAKISGLLGIRARRDNIFGFRLYAKLHSVESCIDRPMTKAKEWAQLQSQGTLHNASNWAHQCSFREYKLAWWNCKSFGQTYVKNIWKKCCFVFHIGWMNTVTITTLPQFHCSLWMTNISLAKGSVCLLVPELLP